jgi:hypothetical protein
MKILFYIAGVSLLVLIFLALFVPTTYFEVKVAFLLIVLSGMIVLTINSKLVWTHQTLIACFLLSLVGLANSLHGQMNMAPGAVRVLTVMAAWPMLYAFFSALLNQPNAIRLIVSTFKFSLIAIVLYSFLYLGNVAGVIPDWMYFELDQGQNANFIFEGIVEYNLYSIASLLFLMPFWAHYLLKLLGERKNSKLDWILLLVGLVICVLSGRRAVQLVALGIPLIVLLTESIIGEGVRGGFRLLWNICNRRNILMLCFLGIGFLSVLALIDIQLDRLYENFIKGFEFTDSSNADASARGEQFTSLISNWYDGNHLFGAGNGSNTDLIRSDNDMPWSYELTYVYLLFSTGIVGVLFYFGWFGWGLLRIRSGLRQYPEMTTYIAPMISGTFGLAIGAASNPYFGKFDYLWILFIPHLFAGALKYQKKVIFDTAVC